MSNGDDVEADDLQAFGFRITRVRLRNYRSIASCDVALGPLALLVGPNASGKSTFLDSLRLVSDGLLTTLAGAVGQRGGFAQVCRKTVDQPDSFDVRLGFETSVSSGAYGFRVQGVEDGYPAVVDEECVIRFRRSGAVVQFRVQNGELITSSENVMPPLPGPDRLYLVTAAGLPGFQHVFEGFAAVGVYNIQPEEMRDLRSPEQGIVLRRDGANVASVLGDLRRKQPAVKERIEAYLQRILPGMDSVDRVDLGGFETIEIRQRGAAGTGAATSFLAVSVSDGTLRALGVLTALFSGDFVMGLGPVGIEEPESGVHPAAAGLLLDAIRDASDRRQVLVTSHSPDLLDSPSVRSNELLAVMATNGSTTIGALDEASRHALDESLFTAGELMRVNQLSPDARGAPGRIERSA